MQNIKEFVSLCSKDIKRIQVVESSPSHRGQVVSIFCEHCALRQRLPCCNGRGISGFLQGDTFERQVALAYLQGWCLQLCRLLVRSVAIVSLAGTQEPWTQEGTR